MSWLDDLLPIRRVSVDGVVSRADDGGLVRDIDFDGSAFSIVVADSRMTVGKADTRAVTYSATPFTITYDATVEIPESTDVALVPALTGHKEGATWTFRIPADTISGTLTISPRLEVQGDITVDSTSGAVSGFDSTKEYKIAVTYTAGGFISIARQVATHSTAVPDLVSATVYGANADQLVLVFDRVVTTDGFAGITLSFSAGTARTVVGFESGIGTTTLRYTLSGALAGTDVATVAINPALCAIRSINGAPVGTESMALALSFYPTTNLVSHWDPSSAMTTSGADITQVSDLVGTRHLLPPATEPTTTTISGRAAIEFIANSYLKADFASLDLTDGSLMMIVDAASDGDNVLVSLGQNGAPATSQISVFDLTGASIYARRRSDTTGDIVVAAAFPLTPTALLFTWSNGTAELRVSGTQTATVSSASWAASVATYNTVAAHGLSTGDLVEITGASPSGYNTVGEVTVVDADTFTIAMVANPGTWTSGGAMTSIADLIGSSAVAADAGDIGRIVFGVLADLATFSSDHKQGEAWLYNARLTGTNVRDLYQYAKAKWL